MVRQSLGPAPLRSNDRSVAPFEQFGAFRVGAMRHIEAEKALREAIEVAKQADAVVVLGGLGPDYESEGCE